MITNLKTVTAKYIANELGLPVIIISKPFPGLNDFVAKCNQDCIFFFDEFEKNFENKNCEGEDTAGGDLLSIMDGVYNNGNTHIFLLTTNTLRINDNLINRPSRIRYMKSFNAVLPIEVVKEILNDMLIDKSKFDDALSFISRLKLSTIDIVKSIIDELNIQKCTTDIIEDIFNIEVADYRYRYYQTRVLKEDKSYTKDNFIKDVMIKMSSYGYKGTLEDMNTTRSINFFHISLSRSIYEYKAGDYISEFNGIVKEPIGDGNVLIAESEDYTYFIYIINPSDKPDLYNGTDALRYAYGYFD